MPQPSVSVDLMAPIFFGSGYTAPVNLQASITNGGNVPLRVREVQIESQGMGTYALYPVRRLLNETIAPGVTKTVSIVATAYTNVSRLNVNEPLTLRTIVNFQASSVDFREVYFTRGVGQ